MKVIKVTPRGYCKGVTRAIALARKTAMEYPDKNIYVLGMLVHNRFVMQALDQLHIHTIDDKTKTRLALLQEIPSGSVVIFTAHGVAPAVKQKAAELGLIGIDASCPDVVKTQAIVQTKLEEGYDVFYIGKAFHPEAEAVISLSPKVHLITNMEDIQQLPTTMSKVFVTNQTTMSIFDIETLFTAIAQGYPQAEFCEEICNATRIRQQAIAELDAAEIDVLYVVGDKHSNNSNRLAQIAKEQGIANVFLIDDVHDITDEQLANCKAVAITAGASTPTYLTNQVIQYLNSYTPKLAKPITEVAKILQ